MTLSAAMVSSRSSVWETPQELFTALDREFAFTLDVCALPHNAKCSSYFTPDDDGLAQPWAGQVCWMNPPYGREIGKWMKKAHEECLRGATVVALVPARVHARWWRRYCTKAAEIRFPEGSPEVHPRRARRTRLLGAVPGRDLSSSGRELKAEPLRFGLRSVTPAAWLSCAGRTPATAPTLAVRERSGAGS